MLPFTGCSWPAHGSYTYAPFEELSVAADVRSRFVSLSGHGDIGADFKTVGELCSRWDLTSVNPIQFQTRFHG